MRDTFCLKWDQAHGAKLVDFHGWNMPVSYASGILAEHEATRTSAGLFNISHMGRLRIHGPQAYKFSQFAFTNDLSKAPIGNALYGFLLNDKGGIIDDVIIYKEANDRFLWIINAGGRESDVEHLTRLASGKDLTIDNLSDSTALLALQGPKADLVLKRLVKDVDLDKIPYFGFGRGTIEGKGVFLMATGYTGEDGYELMVDVKDAPAIWELLTNQPEVTPCGLGARDSLRLEAGLPLHGNDIDALIQPFEAGLGWAVKLEKEGGFFGREALNRDLTRKLIGLTLEGNNIPRSHYKVLSEGQEVGEVTSGIFSPTLKKGIALAYVKKEFLEKPLSVEIRGKAIPAQKTKLPWVRHVTKSKA
ncbi:MAG: glycine cleavage system aminomethyltransferase GcvT [bacterium]